MFHWKEYSYGSLLYVSQNQWWMYMPGTKQWRSVWWWYNWQQCTFAVGQWQMCTSSSWAHIWKCRGNCLPSVNFIF